jgi:hypothetical protein
VAVVVVLGIIGVAGVAILARGMQPSPGTASGATPGLLAGSASQPTNGLPRTGTVPATVPATAVPAPAVPAATIPVAALPADVDPTPTSPPLPSATGSAPLDPTQPGSTWSAIYGWTVAGSLVENDGSDFGGENWRAGLWNTHWIAAPASLQPAASDYAVEAEIQVRRRPECGSFGLVARGTVQIGVHDCQAGAAPVLSIRSSTPALLDNAFLAQQFDPASEWHVYRVEVRGNVLSVAIDGVPVAEVPGVPPTGPNLVGLWDDHTAIRVRAFRVSQLGPR